MAGLNLNPNPYVLATQAALFFTSILSIKKLMVEPYLKVKLRRDGLTSGSQKIAKEISLRNQEKFADIESKKAFIQKEIKEKVDEIHAHGLQKRDAVLKEANREVNDFLEKMDRELEAELRAAKSQLPEVITKINSICFEKIIKLS